MTFRVLLKRLAKAYPTVKAFAQALDVDPSHLSRAMHTEQPFDVRGCLRLARVTGTNPGEVLRAAGKGDIADLIEELYGPAQALLTAEQQDLLAAFDAMNPNVRKAFTEIAKATAAGLAQGGSGSGSGEGGSGGTLLPPPAKPSDYKMHHEVRRLRTARSGALDAYPARLQSSPGRRRL